MRLPPGKARLFDLILHGGEGGIPTADLTEITGLSARCIKSHVWQINELIEDQGYRIRGMGWGGYPGTRDGAYRLVNLSPQLEAAPRRRADRRGGRARRT